MIPMNIDWTILQIIKGTLPLINFIYVSQKGNISISAEFVSNIKVPIVVNPPDVASYSASFLHILFVDDYQSLL